MRLELVLYHRERNREYAAFVCKSMKVKQIVKLIAGFFDCIRCRLLFHVSTTISRAWTAFITFSLGPINKQSSTHNIVRLSAPPSQL
jgi:hypothetical protein